jgi:hypothetical protein
METPPASNPQSRTKLLIVLAFTAFLGLVIMTASLLLKSQPTELKDLTENFLHLLGTTIFVAVCLSVIHEFYLKEVSLQDTKGVVEQVAQAVGAKSATELRAMIKEEIEASMPPRYINIKDVGIVDAYTELQIDRWRKKIENVSKTDIRMLKMWVDDFYAFQTALHSAVAARECTVRIMLIDPSNTEAIKKRASCIPNLTAEHIQQEVILNLRTLFSTWEKLPADKKPKFQIKLHSSFIAVSLYGVADELVFGLYLHGRLATQGTQIKVHGGGHALYDELDLHFENEWANAIPFSFEAYGKDNSIVLPQAVIPSRGIQAAPSS